MKKFICSILLMLGMLSTAHTAHATMGFSNEPFEKVFYFEVGGKGTMSGLSAGNAKPIADTDLMSIEAGMIIEAVSVIIDTAVTGSTALDFGDDDSANGFCPTASITLATPGIYCQNAKARGAYLRVQTAGVTDPADVYVVPSEKYYSAVGKEIKLDNTTTNTAGKFRVIVKGLKLAY